MNASSKVRSRRPLIITLLIGALPLVFVAGLILGRKVLGADALAMDSASSWVAAVATGAIAVLTFVLAKETWYLREAQTAQLDELRRENIRPNVSVILESSPVGMHFVDVKISNHGKGIARKIRFSFHDRDGRAVAAGSDVVVDKFLKLTMFTRGLASLGIQQTISSFVFSFLDLQKELNGQIFAPYVGMRVSFEDVEGAAYNNAFEVDFSQYEGVTTLGGKDALHAIADEVKKIRERLDRITRSHNGRLSVDTYSQDDRDAENEAFRKMREARTDERSEQGGASES